MKRNNHFITFSLLLVLALSACKIKTPENIIPENKMEDILYDYHFAKAVSNDISYNEAYKKEAYKNYVFRKHGITESEFDSSYAWYSRNTTIMEEMYNHIKDRIMLRLDKVDEIMRLRENKFIKTVSADTAELWGGAHCYIMKPLPNSSLIAFSENIDTTFHFGDHIKFKAKYDFINKNDRQKAITTLAVSYINDSVAVYSKETTSDGYDSIYIATSEKRKINKLDLTVFLASSYEESGDSLTLRIEDFELMRYHKPAKKAVNNVSR